jgi:hypothetical protein
MLIMSKLSINYSITWNDNVFTITWANTYIIVNFSSYNYIITLYSAFFNNLLDFGGITLN